MNEKEIIDYWLNMEHPQPVQLATQDAYWQHYRIQAAIAAMQAQLSSYSTMCSIAQKVGKVGKDNANIIEHVANFAVKYADALVAELKKGGEDGQSD